MHIRYIEVVSAFVMFYRVSIFVVPDIVQTTSIKKNDRYFLLGKAVKNKCDQLMCGLQQCERECVVRPMCKMIGYDRNSLTCTLSDHTDTEDDPGNKQVFVSDPVLWTPPTELAGVCAGKCSPGQKCVVYNGGRSTKCVTTECTMLSIENAVISPGCDVGVVGSSVNVSCATGYETRRGNNSLITCRADGSYTSIEFVCHEICESPFKLENDVCAKINFDIITKADEARRDCRYSYKSRLLQITAAKQAYLETHLIADTLVLLDGRRSDEGVWQWDSLYNGPHESLDFLYSLNFTIMETGPCLFYLFYKVGAGYLLWLCDMGIICTYICEKTINS